MWCSVYWSICVPSHSGDILGWRWVLSSSACMGFLMSGEAESPSVNSDCCTGGGLLDQVWCDFFRGCGRGFLVGAVA